MARPSTARWRCCSVVSIWVKLLPSWRSAATALSIACALSGSSQDPKASTRRGSGVRIAIETSPVISGSSAPAGHTTMTCGSECSSALARSRSSRSALISACRVASARPVRVRVRNSAIAVTTPNRMTPRLSTSAAVSCRSSAASAAK